MLSPDPLTTCAVSQFTLTDCAGWRECYPCTPSSQFFSVLGCARAPYPACASCDVGTAGRFHSFCLCSFRREIPLQFPAFHCYTGHMISDRVGRELFFFMILYFTSGSGCRSFSHTNFANSVTFFFSSVVNDCIWPCTLVLKSPSVQPI